MHLHFSQVSKETIKEVHLREIRHAVEVLGEAKEVLKTSVMEGVQITAEVQTNVAAATTEVLLHQELKTMQTLQDPDIKERVLMMGVETTTMPSIKMEVKALVKTDSLVIVIKLKTEVLVNTIAALANVILHNLNQDKTMELLVTTVVSGNQDNRNNQQNGQDHVNLRPQAVRRQVHRELDAIVDDMENEVREFRRRNAQLAVPPVYSRRLEELVLEYREAYAHLKRNRNRQAELENVIIPYDPRCLILPPPYNVETVLYVRETDPPDAMKLLQRYATLVFNGKGEEYIGWRSSWIRSILSNSYPDTSKVELLLTCLKERARSCCERQSNSWESLCIMITRLEREYGGYARETELYSETLQAFRPVRLDSRGELEKLVRTMESYRASLHDANQGADFDAGMTCSMIKKLLPAQYVAEFSKEMRKQGILENHRRTTDLYNWMCGKLNDLSVAYSQSSYREDAFNVPEEVAQECGFNMEGADMSSVIQGREKKVLDNSPKCPLHQLMKRPANHYLIVCDIFKNKTPEKRKEFVAEAKLCFNCLWPNHQSRNCPKKQVCKRCNEKHHQLLHVEKKEYINSLNEEDLRSYSLEYHEELQRQQDLEYEMAEERKTFANATAPSEVNYKILSEAENSLACISSNAFNPLTGKKTEITALLDTGSTVTVAERSVFEELQLTGRAVKLNLNTLTSGTEAMSEVAMITLLSKDGKFKDTITVKLIESFHAPVTPIDWDVKKKDFPYLQDLQFPKLGQSQRVRMIIGTDNAKLLEPLEVRRNLHGGGPIAIKYHLGWAALGRLEDSSRKTGLINTFVKLKEGPDEKIKDVPEKTEICNTLREVITEFLDDEASRERRVEFCNFLVNKEEFPHAAETILEEVQAENRGKGRKTIQHRKSAFKSSSMEGAPVDVKEQANVLSQGFGHVMPQGFNHKDCFQQKISCDLCAARVVKNKNDLLVNFLLQHTLFFQVMKKYNRSFYTNIYPSPVIEETAELVHFLSYVEKLRNEMKIGHDFTRISDVQGVKIYKPNDFEEEDGAMLRNDLLTYGIGTLDCEFQWGACNKRPVFILVGTMCMTAYIFDVRSGDSSTFNPQDYLPQTLLEILYDSDVVFIGPGIAKDLQWANLLVPPAHMDSEIIFRVLKKSGYKCDEKTSMGQMSMISYGVDFKPLLKKEYEGLYGKTDMYFPNFKRRDVMYNWMNDPIKPYQESYLIRDSLTPMFFIWVAAGWMLRMGKLKINSIDKRAPVKEFLDMLSLEALTRKRTKEPCLEEPLREEDFEMSGIGTIKTEAEEDDCEITSVNDPEDVEVVNLCSSESESEEVENAIFEVHDDGYEDISDWELDIEEEGAFPEFPRTDRQPSKRGHEKSKRSRSCPRSPSIRGVAPDGSPQRAGRQRSRAKLPRLASHTRDIDRDQRRARSNSKGRSRSPIHRDTVVPRPFPTKPSGSGSYLGKKANHLRRNPYLGRICSFCGAKGHFRSTCRARHAQEKLNEKRGNFQVICDYPHCQEPSEHYTKVCFDLMRICGYCNTRGHRPRICPKDGVYPFTIEQIEVDYEKFRKQHLVAWDPRYEFAPRKSS